MASDHDFNDDSSLNEDMIDALDEAEQYLTSPCKSIVGDMHPQLNCTSSDAVHPSSYGQNKELSSISDYADKRVEEIFGSNLDEKACSLFSRAEIRRLLQDAFSAGQLSTQEHSQPSFRLLQLPAELRLLVYTHYFSDRNRGTVGVRAQALPSRLIDSIHCCSDDNTWCNTARPWISTDLLLSCKQVYREARDDFLYRGRCFRAVVERHDADFKAICPHLTFWRHIQVLDLEIGPGLNRSPKFETGKLISRLVTMLQGGKNLRSLKLKFAATSRMESIKGFADLSFRGALSITQVFRDTRSAQEDEEQRRKERLERLLFSIFDCSSYNAPAYDFVISSSKSVTRGDHFIIDESDSEEIFAPRHESHITISTGFE